MLTDIQIHFIDMHRFTNKMSDKSKCRKINQFCVSYPHFYFLTSQIVKRFKLDLER